MGFTIASEFVSSAPTADRDADPSVRSASLPAHVGLAVAYTYDGARNLLRCKPLLRGWMHLIWFEASLVTGTLLIVQAPQAHRVATVIYAAAVSGLFGTSALYHRGNWGPKAHSALQRLDHAMIFLLIAGTATPVFATTFPHRASRVMLAVLWSLTVLALVTHLVWMSAPEILVGSTFVALGCLGVAALPGIWIHAGIGAFVLVLTGGVLYILGAYFYHRRWPDPRPDIFGFHEVFHSFVCAAATVQYLALAFIIL
jgi:hemolysin III